MVKSHTHPIGGSTGGAKANIQNTYGEVNATEYQVTGITATHNHSHDLNTSYGSPAMCMAQGYGYGTTGRFSSWGDGNYIAADNGQSANLLAVGAPNSSEVEIKEGTNGLGHRHLIQQSDHSHSLPDRTSSNDAYANENRPENYTVKIWKRTA